MGQDSQAYAHRGQWNSIIPTASVNINSGDYVVMARNTDPISRAVLGTESRIRPASSAYACQWGVGICDSDFNTNAFGAAIFATPTANQALPVVRNGVVRLAIAQITGNAGDNVILSVATSGAQVFTVNNFRRDIGVGSVYKDFAGATANDPQQVLLYEKPMSGRDIYYVLGNRVTNGCIVKQHSVAGQGSTQVNVGATGEENYVRIKNRMYTVARITNFVIGSVNPGGASAIRFNWIVAEVSTTGRGNQFTVQQCTGPFSAFASWTNSGISKGMMIPITWNSNQVPVALVLGWSTTQVTIKSGQILNIGPNGEIPGGPSVNDIDTWYL